MRAASCWEPRDEAHHRLFVLCVLHVRFLITTTTTTTTITTGRYLDARLCTQNYLNPVSYPEDRKHSSWLFNAIVVKRSLCFFYFSIQTFLRFQSAMFLIFLDHLYATNHHAFNANWKSFFAVLIVKKHYAYYNIAIIMYHSDCNRLIMLFRVLHLFSSYRSHTWCRSSCLFCFRCFY